jgi:hypothetical protein
LWSRGSPFAALHGSVIDLRLIRHPPDAQPAGLRLLRGQARFESCEGYS